MSPDEIVLTMVSLVLAAIGWGAWYRRPFMVATGRGTAPGAHREARALLVAVPVAAAAVVVMTLETVSSFDVRGDSRYVAMYFALGMAWLALAAGCFPLLGISTRDDVLERGNASAAYVVAGALLGAAFCYAGGNIGDGPGWWVVLIAAGLATLSLFLVWLLLERLSHVSDAVTIDRDRAAGIRLAAFLIAAGAILGRAVAGDWISLDATIRDFLQVAQPILPLLVMAALIERVARPTASAPEPSVGAYGAAPAALYLSAAALHLLWLGMPA
jgi:uncharacterized membrane protein YjfL (UPF0719 family)